VGQSLLLFCSLCSVQPLSRSTNPAANPPIRISVNRVNVGVTVTNSTGHFIEGLHREDFQLFDNNVEQPITDFLSIEEPAQLLLLIESGPAIALFSNNHLRAADALLTAIAPTDRVAIASYSQRPQLLLDFTANKTQPAQHCKISISETVSRPESLREPGCCHRLPSAPPRKESIVLLSPVSTPRPERTGRSFNKS